LSGGLAGARCFDGKGPPQASRHLSFSFSKLLSRNACRLAPFRTISETHTVRLARVKVSPKRTKRGIGNGDVEHRFDLEWVFQSEFEVIGLDGDSHRGCTWPDTRPARIGSQKRRYAENKKGNSDRSRPQYFGPLPSAELPGGNDEGWVYIFLSWIPPTDICD
jgi:hypothetical protein